MQPGAASSIACCRRPSPHGLPSGATALERLEREGDRIDLGGRSLTVLHLPGHSPGSVGFFDERNGILFSGDALYDGELIDDFPRSDVEHYQATMLRLAALPIGVGHGGHGPSFDEVRKNRLVREYLEGRRVQGCPVSPGVAGPCGV